MAASNVQAHAALAVHSPQMSSPPHNAASPPSKRDLATWWKTFKKNSRREEEKVEPPPVGIFGVSLQDSIKYANVAISLTNEKGESYIYGYVPIVIAKCGVFLKEKATDVEGIFRLNGSAKRIKELQVIFDSPDRYGKGLDWTGYTVHDAANILRRYLNQLPQPIVPLGAYERFRNPLRSHQAQAVGDMEAQAQDVGNFDPNAAIDTYQRLITELPPLNRQLLLYILDLLAVFSSKSEHNRMTSPNLAAIFQPGMLSHPSHDMSPEEYRLSQDVLIFLIENQDSFLVGMSGTAADEKTVKEVQGGYQYQPNTPTRNSLVRSASNASAGADSLRKSGGVRRNMSVSSKNSKASSNVPSPGSPAPGNPLVTTVSGGGVYRSNTVPSKKSPGIAPSRFAKANADPSTPTAGKLSPGGFLASAPRKLSPESKLGQHSEARASPSPSPVNRTPEHPTSLAPVPELNPRNVIKEIPPNEKLTIRPPEQGVVTTITSGAPTQNRKSIFSKSPSSDTERKESRLPNKLRKKNRVPETPGNVSAQSSTNSLHVTPDSPSGQAFYTPMPTPGVGQQLQTDPLATVPPTFSNTQATPSSETPPRIGEVDKMSSFHVPRHTGSRGSSPPLRSAKSPVPSIRSRTSVTEESEIDHTDDGLMKDEKKKKNRWRLSSSARPQAESHAATSAGSRLGSNAIAEKSNASLASASKPRKYTIQESYQPVTQGTQASQTSGLQLSSNESTPSKDKDAARDKDVEKDVEGKKGPIGWIKARVAKTKEERKEREAEKERAKSPPRNASEHGTSKQSLGGIANESLPTRGRPTGAEAEGNQEEHAGVEPPPPA